jgi:hypothetical protein
MDLGEAKGEDRAVAGRRAVGVGTADLDARSLEHLAPVVRRDVRGEARARRVGDDHAVARELGVPGDVCRHQELREHLVVGQGDDVRDPAELRQLSRVLERAAALDEHQRPGASPERVGDGAHRLREARRDVDDDGVAGRGRALSAAGETRDEDRDDERGPGSEGGGR